MTLVLVHYSFKTFPRNWFSLHSDFKFLTLETKGKECNFDMNCNSGETFQVSKS